jgi:hypothetical protein
MANDKIYPINMNPKDILLQNEGGGGMIMNDQFIGIVGNMLPNQKELLDGQDNVNGTNIQTDKFSSNIIITNASSNPIAVGDLASKNFDSLDQSIGTNQVLAPTPKDHCGGEGLLNYEFQELAKNVQSFRELWAPRNDDTKQGLKSTYKPKKGIIDPKYQNEKVKTEDQLKKFLFDQPILDIIKSKITLDGSNFLNVFNYQKGTFNLSYYIKLIYTDRWIHDEDKDDTYSLGKVKDKNKYFKNNNGANKFEVRSIFDIQTLPSGLRSLIYLSRYSLSNNNDWPAVLLVAIGPEELNILTGLGITKAQAFNDNIAKKKALSDNEIYKKFFDQYVDIINAYNIDKAKFLNTVYKITKEEYEKEQAYYIKDGQESQWYYDTIHNQYNLTLLDIGLSIALKYADCPNEYEVVGNVPTSPTPSPSVAVKKTIAPPPTKSEEEEGIYETEFLPATEDGIVLYDGDYGDDCYLAVASAIEELKNHPPNPITDTDKKALLVKLNPTAVDAALLNEINTYISFSNSGVNGKADAKKDWGDGNNVINPQVLIDLIAIGKAAQIKIHIGAAREGHSCGTTSGNTSRHMKGFGVDLPIFYDLTGTIAPKNKAISCGNANVDVNGNPDPTNVDKNGNIKVPKDSKGNEYKVPVSPEFKAICDRFVAAAKVTTGAKAGEGVNMIAYIWYLNNPSKGGNHYNHVHYSNKNKYPGWTMKTVPSRFNCKNCATLKNDPDGVKSELCP